MSEHTPDFAARREQMVTYQIEQRGLIDTVVLHAMREVPREVFVPKAYHHLAYEDTPLPIPGDQTISQPYVVALMISKLKLQPDDRVLEIGTGSGYAAAIMSRIAQAVYTVERIAELVHYARSRLQQLGYDNVHVHHGDGTLGWAAHAPYDGILVSAGGPTVPASLQQQLALHGRLIIPVGRSERRQQLLCVTRTGEDTFDEQSLGPVAFVPLIGAEGWT